jgi:ClpP class serine protease
VNFGFMNRLLRSVISSVWAVDEAYAISVNPIVEQIISGKTVDLTSLISAAEPQMISSRSTGKTIAVIPIYDVLTREDYCGDMGTETIHRILKEYAENPSIGGVILDFNTPGGQAEYIENVVETIASYPKPIVSYVSGSCASAGYWLASNTDAIFTSVKTDRVGSIGTMVGYNKVNPESEDKPRYIQVYVYASKSVDKNKAGEELLKGNHDLYIKESLDPMNNVFLSNVQEGRTGIKETALTGKMYYSQDAIEQGLIDGIKSFDAVVEYISEQINQVNSNPMGIFSRNKKQIQMKNELYSRILGRDVNVGEVLSLDDLQKVQSHIEGLEHLANEEKEVVEEQVEDTTATETATTQQAQTADIASIVSAAVTAAVTPIASRLETIEQTLEIKPAAGATVTTPVSAEAQDFAEKPWEDPNRSYNKLPANH